MDGGPATARAPKERQDPVKLNLPRTFEALRGLRARGLVRESTVEQGKNSGPIDQRRSMATFAERHGIILPPGDPAYDISKSGFDGTFYTDLVSGSAADKRPEFQRMIADAKSGEFDVILVLDTSRFARNRREAGTYEDALHAAGVVVAYVTDGILSTDEDQDIHLAVNQSVDEAYRRKLSRKVRQGFRVRRFERGKWSGTPPLGYRMGYESVYDPKMGMAKPVETGLLIPDTEPQPRIAHAETYTRADLVRITGDLYASGRFGARPLAAHLNQLGYRNAKAEPFSGGSVRHIIENPVYNGWLTWHQRADKRPQGEAEERVRGSHEPLWDDVLWAQITAVRERNFRGQGTGGMVNVYPFRRLAVCDRCGRKMYGEGHGKGQGVVLSMACITQRERHECEQRAVRSSALEDQVGEWLATLRLPDDWRADVERMQRGIAKAIDERPPVDMTRIARQFDNLKNLFADADITREEYVGRKRALMASLEVGRPQPTYSEAVLAKAARLMDELAALWRKATPVERAELAQTLFGEVRVRDQQIVGATLAQPEYLPLIASATVSGAPPDGLGGTRANR